MSNKKETPVKIQLRSAEKALAAAQALIARGTK